MPKTTYEVSGIAFYSPGRVPLDESINVLADNAEQAIKKARQHFLKETWEDVPDKGKNKGKLITRKCTAFYLVSVNKVASAEI